MKKLALLALIALLVIGVTSTLASAEPPPDYTFEQDWMGHGSDSEYCEYAGEEGRPNTGWIHWVFNTKGFSTDAVLIVNGVELYEPGEPLNANVWHFYTEFYELDDLYATIYVYGGLPGKKPLLVISDYCPGVEELDVNKTAVTYYMRTHDWSIAKSVNPLAFHLVMDGSGDGTATWTVDVTYEGYEDSGWNVSGEITIENTGGLDAVITNIEDVLAGEEIDIDCGDTFLLPYDLAVGEILTCTYDEDVDDFIEGHNEVTVTTERDVYGPISVPIVWGDPDDEHHATVNVYDDSDLFGLVWLGSVDAPNDAQFIYYKDFAWADYGHDDCGDYTYENTAEIFGDGDVVLDFAIADLEVYVQCYEFAGETAWAANGGEPGQIPYNPDGGGSWATYVAYDGEAKTTTMFAGQTHAAGTVHFSDPVNGFITITITLDAGWEFDAVAENVKIQDYAEAPSGNPNLGQFAHKGTCTLVTPCEFEVPENNFYGVHADVGKWVPVSGSALLMYFQSMNFHPLYLPAVFGR
jgi:hypothetical protein